MSGPIAWAQAAEPEIDFCVWVLIADGLRVPPFDRHPGGSGALQAVGLTASDWRRWLHAVVAAQAALSHRVRMIGDLSRTTPDDSATLSDLHERSLPPNAWHGSDAVRDGLQTLWTDYAPDGDAWRHRIAGGGGPMELASRDHGRLWQAIDRARTVRRALFTYVVRYPTPVVEALSPDILVLSVGPGRSVDDYIRLVREGITRLEGLERTGT